MTNIIETEKLTRFFGRTEAVSELTMTVPQGSIFAFVGPNGAGKTTSIKLLMNLLEPTAGKARVCGANSRRLGAKDFEQIGYVSENQELPGWMTAGELLDYCRPLYPTWDATLEKKLIQTLSLPTSQKISQLSRGTRMKAALLSSLAFRPRLLVLDEPFSGLDLLVREEFLEGILELSGQGEWTIFISSHDIDEIERLADWIGMIHLGKLQLSEPVFVLQERFQQMEVTLRESTVIPPSLPNSWLQPEQAGQLFRFVESEFDEDVTIRKIRELFPQAMEITNAGMSLRAIFIALARRYRLADSEPLRSHP